MSDFFSIKQEAIDIKGITHPFLGIYVETPTSGNSRHTHVLISVEDDFYFRRTRGTNKGSILKYINK